MAEDKPIRPGRGGDKRWTAENHPVGIPYAAGNPGRPKGSRHKVAEAFLTAMSEDFLQHGADTIAVVRVSDPSTYLRVVASLLPKEIEITRPMADLSDDELANAIELIRATIAGDPGRAPNGTEAEESGKPAGVIRAIH